MCVYNNYIRGNTYWS